MTPVLIRGNFSNNNDAVAAAGELNRMLDEVQQKIEELYFDKNGLAESSDVKSVYSLIGVDTEVGWEDPLEFVACESEVFWEIPPYTCIEDIEDLFIATGANSVVLERIQQNIENWKSLLPPYLLEEFDEEFREEQDDEDQIEFFTRVVH